MSKTGMVSSRGLLSVGIAGFVPSCKLSHAVLILHSSFPKEGDLANFLNPKQISIYLGRRNARHGRPDRLRGL